MNEQYNSELGKAKEFVFPENKSKQLLEQVKRFSRNTVLSLSLLTGVSPDYATAKPKPANAVEFTDSKEKNKVKKIKREQITRDMWTDEAERILVRTSDDATEIYRDMGYIGTLGTSGVPMEKFEQAIDSKTKSFVYTHTHHAGVLTELGWTASDVEQFKQHPETLPALPPSIYDMQGTFSLKTYFGEKKIKISSEVLELSGVWKFELVAGGRYEKMMSEITNEFGSRIPKLLTETDGFTDDEKLYFQNIDLLKTDMDTLMNLFKTEPRLARLKNILDQIIEELGDKFEKEEQELVELEGAASQIRRQKVSDDSKQKVDGLVHDYIARAASLGIKVSYERNKKYN